jgi:hypothetical protein
VRRTFSRATLTSLREMPSEDALALLAFYYKANPTYLPVKDPHSRRWHVTKWQLGTPQVVRWIQTSMHE